MATRLNNKYRIDIVHAAFRDTLEREVEAEKQAEDELVRSIIDPLITDEEHAAFEIVRPFLNLTRNFPVNVRGMYVLLESIEPLPSRWNSWDRTRLTITDDALADRIMAHQQACEKREEKEKEAVRSLRMLVDSYKTFESLAKAWPEGAAYYEPSFAAARKDATLPAVEARRVNEYLGLPKEAA